MVLLLIGSNADADAKMNAALQELRAEFGEIRCSGRHASAASGDPSAAPYLNQAVLIYSALDANALKPRLRSIEARLGRTRPAAIKSQCPIDLDALAAIGGGLTIWDEAAFAASYAQAPITELLDQLGLRGFAALPQHNL